MCPQRTAQGAAEERKAPETLRGQATLAACVILAKPTFAGSAWHTLAHVCLALALAHAHDFLALMLALTPAVKHQRCGLRQLAVP